MSRGIVYNKANRVVEIDRARSFKKLLNIVCCRVTSKKEECPTAVLPILKNKRWCMRGYVDTIKRKGNTHLVNRGITCLF